jgi:hypothetical protein
VFRLSVYSRCNDILKNKDDSPSFLPTRLTAIYVLGNMYETLGRMTGRSYEETVQLLTKGLKNAESNTRAETMMTLGKSAICARSGSADLRMPEFHCFFHTLFSVLVVFEKDTATSSLTNLFSNSVFVGYIA